MGESCSMVYGQKMVSIIIVFTWTTTTRERERETQNSVEFYRAPKWTSTSLAFAHKSIESQVSDKAWV